MSVVILIVGLVLLGLAAALFIRQWRWLARTRTAEGEVVELLPIRQTGDYVVTKTAEGRKVIPKDLYRPVVRFRPERGRPVTFRASLASRGGRASAERQARPYQLGDRVEVLYDRADPQRAQIRGFMYVWFYPLLLFFFGLFAVFMGLVGLVLASTS